MRRRPQQESCFGSVRFSFLFRRGRHLYTLLVNSNSLWPIKRRTVYIKKCLASIDPPEQHESMNANKHICILASAAVLVSCAQDQNANTRTTTKASSHVSTTGPIPLPSPSPAPGKRTEFGTVIGFTASQITLKTATGTWTINRTSSTKVSGTLAVGSTVTVESNKEDWHQVST
jgi:hypothetical protein